MARELTHEERSWGAGFTTDVKPSSSFSKASGEQGNFTVDDLEDRLERQHHMKMMKRLQEPEQDVRVISRNPRKLEW